MRIISSKEVPVSELEGLNRHPHSEQPKPRKRGSSTHTSFRLIVGAAASQYCPERSVLLSQCCTPDCSGKSSPVRAWRKMYRDTDFTCANLGGLSRILHTRKIL